MIVDIILGVAVIVLGVSQVMLGLAVRELVRARRPVDLLARRQQRLESEARIRAINAAIFADGIVLSSPPSSSQSPPAT